MAQPPVERGKAIFVATIAIILLVASTSVAQGVPRGQPTAPWTADLNKYPGLLPELARLVDKLQHRLQFPPERTQSRLLPLLPESTLFYAAIPNYGDVAHQALEVFKQELQDSAVLRDWWRHGDMAASAPKVEDSLEWFSQLSQYLGEEIVVSGGRGKEGRDPDLLIVAEIRKPGLKKLLQQMVKDLGGKSKPPVRILDPQELSTAEDGHLSGEPLVLVRPDFVVGAPKLATLRAFNARLERTSRAFDATPFGQRVAEAYQGGTTIMAAADLHEILSQLPTTSKQDLDTLHTLQRTGFADLKYLVWQHKTFGSQTVSQSELSFISPRHGVAAWLAAPTALGSLDFVSSKAMLAATVVLNNPAQIFGDIKELSTAANPNAFAGLVQMEHALNLSLKEDLLRLLGGELTLELDDASPPAPVWKAILRVTDPARLQQTLNTLLAVAHFRTDHFEQDGVTYYTVRILSPKATLEIGYAFVDGYLIIASSPETATETVELHGTVDSLGKSEKFLASLPPGHPPGASLMLYEDPTAMAAMQLRRFAPQMAVPLAPKTPVVLCAYAEETAIRGASTNTAFDAGAVLAAAAIAIPNMLRARIAANEASAVGSLRTVNTAQVTYATMYPPRGFARDLATLGPGPYGTGAESAERAGLIDATLGNPSCTAGSWCTKSGFRFRLTAVCKQEVCKEFVAVGTPLASSTGTRSFCSTSDGVIRFKAGEPLTSMLTVPECQAWTPVN